MYYGDQNLQSDLDKANAFNEYFYFPGMIWLQEIATGNLFLASLVGKE